MSETASKTWVKELLKRVLPQTTPIGTVINYMGTKAPEGYLICDGTVYNIADYPKFADFLEEQFGSKNQFGGDGTTTFAVPDLRGEFLRGSGENSHTNQGNGTDVGVHQDGTEIPNVYVSNYGKGIYAGSDKNINGIYESEPKNEDYTKYSSTESSSTASHINRTTGSVLYLYTSRPTNTSVLYCIKIK